MRASPLGHIHQRLHTEIPSRGALGEAREAQRVKATIQAQKATVTVAQLVARFLGEVENDPGYAPPRIKAIANYRRDARVAFGRVLPVLGARAAAEVTTLDVEALRDRIARQRKRTRAKVQSERAAKTLAPASVDTVVVTFTLCSIADVAPALAGMRRVLRPEGRLLFLEHGASPEPGVRRWQGRVNPLWRRVFGGCQLTREAPVLLQGAGFAIERVREEALPGAPAIAGYTYRGVARPA